MAILVLASFIAGLVMGACAMRLRLHYQVLAEQERARRHSRIAWLVTGMALQRLNAELPFRGTVGSEWGLN